MGKVFSMPAAASPEQISSTTPRLLNGTA